MTKKYPPIDLNSIKTYPIQKRQNKVKIADFAKPGKEDVTFTKFVGSLPSIFGGKSFREVTKAIANAYRKKRPVILAMGAHVIKCGSAPL